MGSGSWRWRVAGAAILATACTVDGSSGDFGGVPTASASGPSQTNGSDDDDDETEGEEDTESESSGSTGGTAGSTGMAMTGGSTGMSMGSTGMGMGSTGMGDDSGLEQPADGMYSECMVPADCSMVTSNVCVTINGGSGFCTNMGCTNPAVDCDPSPGGTAPPICFPVDDTLTSCALDCSAGQICPTGMTCTVLANGSICG